jgi:hypothetical protein
MRPVVKRRNSSSDMDDATRTENTPFGTEPSPDALSANGNQTDDPEHTANSNGLPPQPLPSTGNDLSRAELEERLRRLEESLAQLYAQNQTASQAAQPPPPTAQAVQDPPVARIVALPPAPITTAPTEAAASFLLNVGKQMLTTAPLASVAQPVHPTLETNFHAGVRWTWFFFDAYAEVRAILRMFVDPRYQLSWTSRMVPLVLAILLLTSSWWMPGTSIPWLGTLIDKLVDLTLAYLFFRVLSHEARRYRQLSPDLPASLRLPPER